MNAKKIFVDAESFLGNDSQNPIGHALQQIAQLLGEFYSSAEDADIVIVGTSQAAMKALSASGLFVSGTSQVILAAVKEGWKDELTIGANLRESSPDRFSMYGLLPVAEMAVEGVEGLFDRLK